MLAYHRAQFVGEKTESLRDIPMQAEGVRAQKAENGPIDFHQCYGNSTGESAPYCQYLFQKKTSTSALVTMVIFSVLYPLKAYMLLPVMQSVQIPFPKQK